ncbi:hypothetical protein FD755_006876 [Muntiacus reevesi]|uniref:RNA helicase n=1 Tax=Muntiacus reevesi TaxID=9886 RepID=A0A5J5MXQ3_MUNRE|nr:hypothetical protein FD755_006876 [Muntiacus reevesi]
MRGCAWRAALSNLHLKEEKIKPDANGAVVKTNANAEKADEEEKEDRAAQSLLNKLIRSNLVDNTNQVEVLQRDPSSPLYSVKSFEELRLKPQLLQGVYAMGFNRPSKIQENALPLMLAEPPQNLIAQSQSGTGKTAAFVLAMLSQVEPANRHPQCLCLSPTYELALQTGKVIEQMGKFYPELKLAYAVRGNKLERGQKISEHIVIGTPGTVLDWCSKLKFIDPKKIKVFVLDEADVMIATQGHQDQSIRIQSNNRAAAWALHGSTGIPADCFPSSLQRNSTLSRGERLGSLFSELSSEALVWHSAWRPSR